MSVMDGSQSMELAELTSWFYSTQQNFDFRQSLRDNVSPSSSIFSMVSKFSSVCHFDYTMSPLWHNVTLVSCDTMLPWFTMLPWSHNVTLVT